MLSSCSKTDNYNNMTYSEARDLLSEKNADVDVLKFDLALKGFLQDELDLEEILSELVARYHQLGDIKFEVAKHDVCFSNFEESVRPITGVMAFASDAILDNITRLASVSYGAFNRSSTNLKLLNAMFIRIFSKIDKKLKDLQYANGSVIENVRANEGEVAASVKQYV